MNLLRNQKLIFLALYLISGAVLLATIYLPKNPRDISWLQYILVFLSFLFLTRYFVYMVISPWYDTACDIWRKKNQALVDAYRPYVSVIIPAWNEAVGIISTVESVLASTYDNLEIIVVNDGSTDESDELLKNFVKEFERAPLEGKTITYLYKENGGKGTALNRGIEVSSGEIIVSIDADCLVHKEAITHFVTSFADPRVMAAVGNVKVAHTGSFLATVQSLEFLFSFYLKRADALLGSIYIIGGAAGAFRKEIFDRLGLYSTENITEDIELSIRIQKAGYKIAFASDAVVYTEGANTLNGLLKQRLRWKRGRMDTFIEHGDLFFSTKRKHNKFLSWVVLPFAVFGDTTLFLEIPFITFLLVYAFLSSDFTPFAAAILIVSLVFFVRSFTRDSKYDHKHAYLIAPIAWIMFYVVMAVEVNALVKSLWGLLRNKEVVWQRWERTGISTSQK